MNDGNKSCKVTGATGILTVRGRTRKPYETAMSLQKEHLKYVEKCYTFPSVDLSKKEFTVLTYF